MGLGEVWWFLDGVPAAGAAAVLELLDGYGLRYRHPGDESVYVLDEVGHRRESSVAFVASEWAARRKLTMQLWLDADIDVVTSIQEEGTLVAFGLDGLTRHEAERTVAGLVLSACVIEETRALVADRDLPDIGEELLTRLASTPMSIPGELDLFLGEARGDARSVRLGRTSWLRPSGSETGE
jgi:hypothetical protein